jgi:predicted TIM-barrel fold metal-dependent hydrolase
MSDSWERLRALEKVDPHHHLWDLGQGNHPWLIPPVLPRMYGDYLDMCKDFLIEDFVRDSRPHNVVRSVHVQANWDATDPVAETRWVQGIADRHGFPHGIVAHADLAAPDAERVLAEHAEFANTRGIRQIIGHTDDPDCTRPDPLGDPAWERGYAALARFGFSFDLQLFPQHMPAAAAVAARHPDVPVVVCHTGFPFHRSPDWVERWRQGMSALAALPHVHAKLSGPHMVMPDWTAETFAPFIHDTIERFGPDRCMFASNVPPDALSHSYDEIYEAFYAWAQGHSEAEQRSLFHDTAAKFYRLDEP